MTKSATPLVLRVVPSSTGHGLSLRMRSGGFGFDTIREALYDCGFRPGDIVQLSLMSYEQKGEIDHADTD